VTPGAVTPGGMAALAAAVLREVPGQVLAFMRARARQ